MRRARFPVLVLGAALAAPLMANGLGENVPWQFQSLQDKAHKGGIVDLVERKKAGYYDAIRPNYNYTTYIDKQVNCTVSAATTGNSGSNATTASTASPTVSNAGSTDASAAANSATNGLSQAGLSGVIVAGNVPPPTGGIDSAQNNTGSLGSSVTGSNTSAATGAVSSTGGVSDQVLNSNQSSTGTLTASVAGSTACIGPLNAR